MCAEPIHDIELRVVAKEPLVAILPSDHRLAQRKTFDPSDLAGETYIGISIVPRVLRAVIADYFKQCGIKIVPALEIDNYAMAISLIASTRGVALLPASAKKFPAAVGGQPPAQGRGADHRSRRRLSQGQYLARLKGISFTDRRTRHKRAEIDDGFSRYTISLR
jgi:LysR family hca operon transcriptional activator